MKKTKLSFQIIWAVILTTIIYSNAFSCEIETHRAITSKAIGVAKLSTYLQDNLGIQVSTPFKDISSNKQRSAFSWIAEGTGWEDNPPR
jgi:hypothetical protein